MVTNDCLIPHTFRMLPPSDHFLFPSFEKWLGGRTFASSDQLSAETNPNYQKLDIFNYLNLALKQTPIMRISTDLKKVEKRWMKCMKLKRDDFKKQNVFLLINLCFIEKVTNLLTSPHTIDLLFIFWWTCFLSKFIYIFIISIYVVLGNLNKIIIWKSFRIHFLEQISTKVCCY